MKFTIQLFPTATAYVCGSNVSYRIKHVKPYGHFLIKI